MNRGQNNAAISVVTYISSLGNAANVFSNYMQQEFSKKELIMVHTNPQDDFDQWLFLSRQYPMTRLYALDHDTSLGKCLNYCVEHAIFENIAIMNEKHVYMREYLAGSLNQMNSAGTDFSGKRTYIALDRSTNQQNIINPGNGNCYTDFVILPTLLFKQSLFGAINFDDCSENLDSKICERCLNNNIRIYSSDSSNFIFNL